MSALPKTAENRKNAPVLANLRERNRNLPGMGGIFNYVNLHVYHYAGNNPVKYVDPDGRRSLFFWEKISVTTILGKGYGQVLQGIDYNKSRVSPDQFKSGIAGYHSFSESDVDAYIASEPNLGKYGISLPNGSIYLPKDARNNSFDKKPMRSLLLHEIFHQLQYSQLGKANAVNKFFADNNYSDPYDYDLQSLIGKTLNDIPTLEGQAQFIEDFVNGYYNEKSFFKKNDNFSPDTVNQARILRDSGFNSRAINRVLD